MENDQKNVRVIIGVVVALVIIIGIAALIQSNNSKQTGSQANANATSTTATSTPAIPGDNLALGEDKNATYGTYLIGYNGMPLYTYALDTSKISYCVNQCANVWKPYIVTSTSTLTAESPIKGKIDTISRDDGSTQLTYNGHPLYFYAYDTTASVKGAGVRPNWTLAQP